MANLGRLIEEERVVGAFRGFSEGGLEFHADLVLPYNPDLHKRPIHGHFLLVELESEEEAALGRITSIRSQGGLVSQEGEDYLVRLARRKYPPPEDVKESFLKYRVDIRVLGVVRIEGGRPIFVPSHRRIPHVGSRVAFPSDELLRWLVGHYEKDEETNKEAALLGYFSLGEFIWAGEEGMALRREAWMRILSPSVHVRFAIRHLVSRRSFVFARAGFGKSNLVKLLFSELYREDPTVPRGPGKAAPVGTLIFDREGEYFFPDHKGRPGLADVPHLQDRLVVFTPRKAPSPYYETFVAGPVKLDLRHLSPSMVLEVALSPERQEQQNVRKLKSLPMDRWWKLVDLVAEEGNQADLGKIKELLKLDPSQGDVEAIAARSNLDYVLRMLHDPESRFLERLMAALREGKLCVVDLSLFGAEAALAHSGLVLSHLFRHNQERFTAKEADTIPVIAVLEEAQSVLRGEGAGYAPYVAWVKEGRKYDLGAVLITQQPGSIPEEILSQGDNWFVFHLLSAGDLKTLQRANAHYSEDLLSSLLNEPIPGQCVFWSSASGRTYPVPLRVVSFEDLYRNRVGGGNRPGSSYVPELIKRFPGGDVNIPGGDESTSETPPVGDFWGEARKKLLKSLPGDPEFKEAVASGKVHYWDMARIMQKHIGTEGYNPQDKAFMRLMFNVIKELMGPEGGKWKFEKKFFLFEGGI